MRPSASASSSWRTCASRPGWASTSTRVTRPARPASRCRSSSGITATSASASGPIVPEPSTSETRRRGASPRSSSVTEFIEPAGPPKPPSSRAGLGTDASVCALARIGRPSACALAWLRPTAPAASVSRGSVCASPSSTVSAVSAPASETVRRWPSAASIVAVCSSSGAACLTPGSRSTRASMFSPKPSAPRARSCSVAGPVTSCTSCAEEPATLPPATSVANTSATLLAMPSPAKSSCTPCTRRRRRYR